MIAVEQPHRKPAIIAGAELLRARRPFTVAEYYQMAETGMLGPDERTELLDGEVVIQMPINSRHAGCVNLFNEVLLTLLTGRVVIAIQNPVRLGPFSEPQPDIAVLAPRVDRYRNAHPQPADVLLLVEVADSSLDLDRHVKAPLYAAAGIRELWIVDLINAAVEVYRDPDERGYRNVRRFGHSDRITPAAFPDLSIAVDDLLGSRD